MRIDYLEYFVKVVEFGSITGAANALYISPQGVSKIIQKLESELNVQIFDRSRKSLLLTQEGQDVYQTALSILKMQQALYERLENNTFAQEERTIYIFSAAQINATFLPTVLNKFYRRNPGVKISLFEEQPEDMVRKLSSNGTPENSILLFALPSPVPEQLFRDRPIAFDFVELTRCPLMACVSNKSPLLSKHKLQLQELVTHPLITYNLDARLLTQALETPIDLPIIFNSTNLMMCRSVLADRIDAVGITNLITEQYQADKNLCALPVTPTVEIIYGYLADRQHGSHALKSFLNVLESEFR
jgi:DNA-binding transcriptional LysR family regulator